VREGLALTDSRVVQHLHNLARALVRPQDDVAWATLLTGPWVEPDLVSLAAAAKTPGEVWPEKLGRFAAFPTCPSEVAHLTRMLLSARERVGREFLSETLERFLEASGAWTGVAAWEGALGVACARTYLKLVEESETGLAETTFLKTDFALEEAYQPPDPRAEDSPLEVLTVHGAKGLEFHTVFLPYLDWRPLGQGGQSPPFLLEEVPGTRAHVLGLAPPAWRTGKDSSYRLVKILQDARVLAEARRVFYVAVTRAQQRLFLSGVLSRSQGTFAPPSDSPLAWLWQHYRPAEVTPGNSLLWTDPVLRVEMFPEISQVRRSEMKPPPLPEPWEFLPEPPPYRLSFPSQAADVELQEKVPVPEGLGGEWDNLAARARGEVTHRLLQSQVLGEGLPGEPGVAAALVGLGVPWETAQTLAPEILAEVRACLQDPFLGGLLFSQSSLTEWLLEDQPAPSVIRRGRLDLLAFDGREWWLVDFKTSRPPQEGAWENFLLFEQEKYRPQLLAYREMTAKAKGISPEIIRLALYFTACRKAVEL